MIRIRPYADDSWLDDVPDLHLVDHMGLRAAPDEAWREYQEAVRAWHEARSRLEATIVEQPLSDEERARGRAAQEESQREHTEMVANCNHADGYGSLGSEDGTCMYCGKVIDPACRRCGGLHEEACGYDR